MNEIATLLIMAAVLGGGLLVQRIIGHARATAPEPAAETMAILPDGRVEITSSCGRSFVFRRDEVWSVRARDRIGGLAEVIVDLFDRRLVVGVTSDASRRDMLQRLARLRLDPI